MSKKQLPPQNRLQQQSTLPRIPGQPVSINHNVQHFQGPIPPPEILSGYNNVVTGAAERIIKLAELEVAHRHQQETAATQANIEAQRRQLDIAQQQVRSVYTSDKIGQALGFTVSVLCLGASVYLGVNGQPWLGGVLASLPLAGIIRALRDQAKKPPPASK